MKARNPGPLGSKLVSLSIVLAAHLVLGVAGADAQVGFPGSVEIQSVSDFYAPLASHGNWYDLPAYGRCWHPAQVEPGWRPYSVGYWEWTDYGWYWVSDEPWAWACYHYGSWVYDPVYGWVWIPGTEWAPAWVVWRESPADDYIGWAPCAPSGVVLAPSSFVFVDTPHFRDRLRPDRLIVNNTTIINRTRVINNITQETHTFGGRRQRIAVNRGPGVDPVQRATGARIAPKPIEQVVTQTPVAEAARRRSPGMTEQRPQAVQQPTPPPANRQEQPQHIYRQPVQPLAATGREEPRIYHEAPATIPPGQSPPAVVQPPQVVVPNQAPQQPSVPERTVPPREERGAERFRESQPPPPSVAPPTRELPPSPEAPPSPQQRNPEQNQNRDRG